MKKHINLIILSLLILLGCSKQEGCTDINACNYDEKADSENGTCIFPEQNYDCTGGCLNDIDNDGVCDENELFIFSLGEGNFQSSNSSLWYIDNNENVYEAPNNPLGDTGQSLYVHENKIFTIINGSGVIHMYNINANGIEFDSIYDTNFSGPRNMVVYENKIFITEWYTNQIRVLDLNNQNQIALIATDGMPENLLEVNGKIYVTINMNLDWSAGNSVIEIDPTTYTITNNFIVANNPQDIDVQDNNIYISSTYYDENWNSFHAMSKIDLNSGDVIIYEDNSGLSFGPDINIINQKLFRVTSNGTAELNINNLAVIDEIIIDSIGNVYSMDFLNEKFYFGITDFVGLNNVIETDFAGNFLNTYNVGVIPGSFAVWNNN